MVAVEATVFGFAVLAIMHASPEATPGLRLAILLALSLGYATAADRVSMLRRYLQLGDRSAVWTNQTSIWTFAAALTLPLGYAVVLVLATYGHILARGWRQRTIRTYRVVFAIATTLIGVYAAAGLAHVLGATASGVLDDRVGPNLLLAGQLAAYALLSLVPAVGGIRLYGGARSVRAALPAWRSVGTELATLVLGALTAQLIMHDIWLTPLVVVLAVALHRSSLVRQLAIAARLDAKTGLLNADAWNDRAAQALARAARDGQTAGVLLIDLDHFKAINDQHGHLAGDDILRAVGASLRATLRTYDEAGRFGGEEFVVLLDRAAATDTRAIAERIRADIAHRSSEILDTPVTASIGAALTGHDTDSLESLLAAADAALYRAKSAGRDRVELAATAKARASRS